MATFSSHLLDATNGSHAANVEVIIYQINENGKRKFSVRLNLMKVAE